MTLTHADEGALAVEETGVPSGGVIITIDGPAGTGKSSVARALALRLGLDFLDTGSMYRAAAATALDSGVDVRDGAAVIRCVERVPMRFDFRTDPPTLSVGDRVMTRRVREPDVEGVVSPVSAIPGLRKIMVEWQRAIAREHPRLVTEGRDQGTVVFPDARVKFYLHAAAEVRAARRAEQLRRAGQDADERQLLKAIQERDQRDSTRADGPLRPPVDAEVVDTSAMSFERVVDTLEEHARARVEAAGLGETLRPRRNG